MSFCFGNKEWLNELNWIVINYIRILTEYPWIKNAITPQQQIGPIKMIKNNNKVPFLDMQLLLHNPGWSSAFRQFMAYIKVA